MLRLLGGFYFIKEDFTGKVPQPVAIRVNNASYLYPSLVELIIGWSVHALGHRDRLRINQLRGNTRVFKKDK